MEEKISIDKRINSLIYKCADKNIRSLFVIYGPKSMEQIMAIYLQINSTKKNTPSILWCHKSYSKEISDLRQLMLSNKKLLKTGKKELTNDFDGFLASSRIRFCNYDESQNVLGNTYDLCIIQDFQAITPNILCRLVETVSGGGSLIILFPNCSVFKDIEQLPLDIHNKLRTVIYPDVYSSYMKRFLKSFTWCKTCLVLDDKLEVCTEYSMNKASLEGFPTETDEELQNFIKNLDSNLDPLPRLIKLCKTIDQAKAVIKMVEVLKDSSVTGTLSLTAARGRGKSAALGLATAAAIYLKVVNIYVVAPSPDNLNTYFQFVLKGFDALDYVEETHYSIYQSVNPDFNKSIISITVMRENFQYIQYLEPVDHKKLANAHLVLIDEAAAIPLTQVKALVGPYNILMASTINGYEGTGRCFSLKLLSEFRQLSVPMSYASTVENQLNLASPSIYNCRPFYELTLEKSIRYSSNDPLESWLYDLLCLNATSLQYSASYLPAPSDCELYYVNKKFLFSGCKQSEKFLNQIVSLLVASHYKNKPDDLLTISDSTSHHLFVLVPTITANEKASLPTVFSLLQICCEGGLPLEETQNYDNKNLPNGDLVPWTLHKHFRHLKDLSLPALKCVRIVRLATNSDYQSMGYGSTAVKLLIDYYKKDFVPLESKSSDVDSTEENILLTSLTERTPEPIDYIGVSYGITPPLYKFWKKLKFSVIRISQIQNEITGECNCIMIHPIEFSTNDEQTTEETLQWPIKLYHTFSESFKAVIRFEPLRNINLKLATEIMHSIKQTIPAERLTWEQLEKTISSKDILRLGLYSKRQADRFLILYLMSDLAELYFANKLHSKSSLLELSFKQSALLVSFGYQGKHSIEEISKKLDCAVESTLALLNRTIAIIYKAVAEVQKSAVRADILANQTAGMNFLSINIGDQLDEDVEEFAKEQSKDEQMIYLSEEKSFSIKRKSTTMGEDAFNKAIEEPRKKKNKRKKH